MRILIVQTGFIGDIILTTPLLAALAQRYPGAELSLLTTPVGCQLFGSNPLLTEVVPFDKRSTESGLFGLFAKAKSLRERNYDIVFSLHKSYRTAALLFLARIPKRYGFKTASASFLYSKTCERLTGSHEVLRNGSILRCVGDELTAEEAEMTLAVSEEAHSVAATMIERFSGKRFVAMAPGSVWATKRWPAQHFAELAEHVSKAGFQVVLIGGPGDVEVADEVESKCASTLTNLVAKTSLEESAALIARSAAVVCNDSGPLHMASAMKTPVLVFFCATVPEFGFGPWKTNSRILGVEGLTCRPCGRHGKQYCPTSTHACQLKLLPEQAMRAFDDLLTEADKQIGYC